MSGIRPFFITGANAKIKLNGKTLAFCTDLSYSIQMLHKAPKVLGMYEGTSVEPLGYNVTGTFTVVRYAKDAATAIGASAKPAYTNDAGNGVGNWAGQWGGKLGDFLSNAGVGNDGRADEAMNPSKFDTGTTFDIQVYQKVNNPGPAANSSVISDILSVLGGSVPGHTAPGKNIIGVANIRNCRITQSDFQLTKKGTAVQRFTFIALYVDEDSFVADFSGKGQQFDGGA